jgi:cob(I)alamin adenosyltransferase
MGKRIVQVFYGPGKGKTSAAVGQCIRAASLGQSVIIIQFLKGKDAEEFNFLERLEPDIKLFRFEKSEESYDLLLKSRISSMDLILQRKSLIRVSAMY